MWLPLIRMALIAIIVLGFLSTFTQANFIDIIIPGYMLLIMFTTINTNYINYLHQFYALSVCLLIYDLFWLFFVSTVIILIILVGNYLGWRCGELSQGRGFHC